MSKCRSQMCAAWALAAIHQSQRSRSGYCGRSRSHSYLRQYCRNIALHLKVNNDDGSDSSIITVPLSSRNETVNPAGVAVSMFSWFQVSPDNLHKAHANETAITDTAFPGRRRNANGSGTIHSKLREIRILRHAQSLFRT